MTERRRRRCVTTAFTAAVVTVAALLSGCAAASTEAGAASTTGTSAPAASAPAGTPAAASASVGAARASLKDSAPFQALTAEQQSRVGALEAMDVATFQQQSRDDQLAYGAFLREVYPGDAVAGAAGNSPDPKLPAARKMSSSDTGEQVANDQLLKAATARAAGGNYAKMAPTRVSPLLTGAYAEVSSVPATTGAPDASGLPESTGMTVEDESNTFLPMDGSLEELTFKIVQMRSTSTEAPTQFWFAYTPFTNIHGEQDGAWILMFKAGESQEKWVPDLSVID
ncbi:MULTISPECIES: hypothetical protein [unclassified Arthrobacter]|uniref:hypothetical protein n=1 Tax=unclassified Arthrobacter TaxID=235627 RepID=UPI002E07C162|nr:MULTISPECIES: hypothetical protein [unclassified Arthrobacter]MEC5192962.1 hypothetical protein [Arthrobacter sp. MP_M4]MEC5204491.1 hypothetical protein [Arthrobacter sp. MP_M7]